MSAPHPLKSASDWNWEYTQVCASDPAVHGQLLPSPQNVKFINAIQRDALVWALDQIVTDGNPDVARDKITDKINQLLKHP